MSEHLLVLSRMRVSIESDTRIPARRKNRLLALIAELMAELNKPT